MCKYLPLILVPLESGSVSGSGYFPTSDEPTTPRPTTPEATTEEPTTPEATTFGPTTEEPTTPSTFLYSFYACCNFFTSLFQYLDQNQDPDFLQHLTCQRLRDRQNQKQPLKNRLHQKQRPKRQLYQKQRHLVQLLRTRRFLNRLYQKQQQK